jgi:hypothetical protein
LKIIGGEGTNKNSVVQAKLQENRILFTEQLGNKTKCNKYPEKVSHSSHVILVIKQLNNEVLYVCSFHGILTLFKWHSYVA